MIDLRSDTVTKPTAMMRQAMTDAAVGDDVFGEDSSINALEQRLAKEWGHEAGLFCPSGTMANQVAIRSHCRPGDQVICSWAAHVYNYEGGGMALNSGVTAKLLEGERGLFNATQVKAAIYPDDVHFPLSRMVIVEDTSNKGGGALWPLEQLREISALCRSHGLVLHLDGARLYNRLVADQIDRLTYGQLFDTISICLSKGLGAPVGSVLLGSTDFIAQARRVRKAMGGGMRQAGILAAACSYALDHHVNRLADDHNHAKELAAVLESQAAVASVMPVESNIILFDLVAGLKPELFIASLADAGILALRTGGQQIRFVFHLDVSAKDVKQIKEFLKSYRPA